MKNDEYQARYELHQKFGKKQELVAIMRERHSNRRFSDIKVSKETIEELIDATKHCPSSCDRHGVRIRVCTERNDKDLLDGLLVGGTGWIYRAPVVLLLLADPMAYKADGGRELQYNAYVDAGVMLAYLSLMAEKLGLHGSIINPNIRDENKQFFAERFTPAEWNSAQFCGAFAFGYPHEEPIEKKRNLIEDMEVK